MLRLSAPGRSLCVVGKVKRLLSCAMRPFALGLSRCSPGWPLQTISGHRVFLVDWRQPTQSGSSASLYE